MPLNKLENFIKNYEGRILYVNSNDLDATDSITNQGNSLTKPFKTIQRALIESARFSFVTGNDNDKNDRTTILVFPGEHLIDNRPGFGIRRTGTATAEVESPSGQITAPASDKLSLTLESNFDLTQEDNVLYKFNSIHGGVILPRGTSLVGLDLRKTKIRPKYVPNPTDSTVPSSAIFRITGNCYFWQFSLFDANPDEFVYTNNRIFTEGSGNRSLPTFSHHKLTCFEYADGVNVPVGYDITDLDMYYAKLSHAFNEGSGRQIPASQKYPLAPLAFAKERPEWEIVGAFGTDPVNISSIVSGDGATPTQVVTVVTQTEHGLTAGTPIKIRGVNTNDYNVSTVVQSVSDSTTFTYLLPFVRNDLDASPSGSATVTIETDTVKGSSPYIFNTSLRSTWGLNGMKADGSKASGFKSMVVAQFTAISLQKDDRSFVKYDPITRTYSGIPISTTVGTLLSSQSSSTNTETVYHLDPRAIYRPGWETSHIKVINDAFIQIVSVFAIGFNKHFDVESGGDGSVTNSNSNFGQYSLAADGFRKDAFDKDDHGFITSVITPKYIPPTERNIDWVSIDVGLTTAVGVSSHLYLFGFNTEDNVPPNLLQGYRVGARVNDKLYLSLPNGTIKTANILMTDNVVSTSSTLAKGTSTAYKEYTVSSTATAPNYDTLTLSSSHTILTGTKILILSDDGDLPENITENKIYYAIRDGVTTLKIASSVTNAQNGIPITMYGGSNLRIVTRLSDVNAGELGSPIQYDPNHSNWFVFVDTANEIYPAISALGVAGFDEPRTDVTFIKRIEDSRSLDEKIYKVRIVVPKESVNAKDPQDGFILQESNSTGPVNNAEFSLSNITAQNYNYKRNPRFISTCSESSGTVTVVTELPHNLSTGDRVIIKNVKSSTNVTGVGVTGYNGDFTVTVSDNKTFTYSTTDNNGVVHNVGIFSGFSARNTSLPRFERNDLKSNFFIYRAETLSPYIYNVQDGVYHAYILNAKNAVPDTFTNYKYSQSIVDLYPQKDPDNIEDNPTAAKTFAKRAPLGEVVTSDLKRSVTRETLDELVKKLGVTPIVSSVTTISGGISTITTSQRHGLNGIVGYTTLTSGTGYSIGTHYNVRLLNQSSSWDGATADIVVSGAGNSITSLQIVDGGAGYGTTTLTVEGFAGATVAITTSTISRAEDNSLQITGLGTVTDGLYRIVSVPSANRVAIARTSGDPSISSGQYLLNVAPTVIVNNVGYSTVSGISTVSCVAAHGLVAGNKFKIVDSSNNSIGDFVVTDTIGIHTFTFRTTSVNPSSAYRVLKHGFSANDLVSETGTENLGARGVSFYGNESAVLLEDIGTDSVVGFSTFSISVSNSGVSTTTRFPLGSYIQINNEIMKIASSTLSGAGNNKITVLRGVLGTQKSSHLQNSLIKKIKPLPVEFRRPSILRASGHTFEYLGYGPGNYSTGLPQIQARTLTEREDFLSQSQEKSCGSVVYTGMNSDGDFFIGNTKYSSASGEQTTFDIPIPTVTGQDPSRLSAVFDEIIVKERILVEGGKSKQILSQFDGPVTFNENVIMNDEFKLNGDLITTGLIVQKNSQESGSPTTGSITTKGGLGVSKSLNIGGNLNIAGVTTFQSEVAFNSGLVPDSFEDAYIGRAELPWASAWIAGIGIATEGVPGGTEVQDRTINAWTGDLVLTSTVGIVSVTDNLEVGVDLLVKGNTILTGIATVNTGLVPDADEGAYLGTATLPFSEAHVGELRIGVTDDNTIDTATGGLIFNSVTDQTTIQDMLTVTGISTFNSEVVVDIGIVPDVDKGAYLGTTGRAFEEAHIDGIRIGVGGTTKIDTRGGQLVLDSNFGQVVIDDQLSVTGISTFDSAITMNAGLTVDNIRLGVTDDNTIDTKSGTLTLDSAANSVIVSANLNVTGISTLQGQVIADTGIVPDADEGAYLGTASLPWSELHVGELQLAVGTAGDSDNTITTASGDLFLDSNGNKVHITANAEIDGTLQVDNTSSFKDSITLEGSSKTLVLKDSDGGTTKLTLSSSDGSINVNSSNFTVAGSSGNTSIKGILAITNITDASSSTDSSASFRTAGGGAIAKKLYVGNTLTVSSGGISITGSSTFGSSVTISSGGLTVSAGGISASGQTVTASSFTGTAAQADALKVQGLGDSTGPHYVTLVNGTPSENSYVTQRVDSGLHYNSSSNTLTVSGDIIAYGSGASDDRLKTNKSIISDALAKVDSLSGFTFDWNEKAVELLKLPSGIRQIGVSAQEVQSILPEAVKVEKPLESDEEFLMVKYERLVPLLIQAIKELKAEVDELKKNG